MLWYVVLFASLCCVQTHAYPQERIDSSCEYEAIVDKRSRNEKQLDQIVKQILSCINFTLNEAGFIKKLNAENRSTVEEMAITGVKSYVDYVYQFVKVIEDTEKGVGYDDIDTNEDSESETEEDLCTAK